MRGAMAKRPQGPGEGLLAEARDRKRLPYEFVLDELADLAPTVRAMFGAHAVYVGERIVLILRRKQADRDDGVWVATEKSHHAALRPELPSMRSIEVFGAGETSWQVIPDDGDAFEEEVLRACALIRAGDPRIGRVPAKKRAAKTPSVRRRR